MSQDPGPFDYATGDVDPGPGTALSFGLCFLSDFAITFFAFLSAPGSLVGAGGKFSIYIVLFVPLAANGIAIWWAAATKRERCLKGLVICTGLLVLLDAACVGLSF
jgi:hypothetical protein